MKLSTVALVIVIITLIMLIVLYGLALDFGISTGIPGAEGPPGVKGDPGLPGAIGSEGSRGPRGDIGEENPPFDQWRSGVVPLPPSTTTAWVSFEQPFTEEYRIDLYGTLFGTEETGLYVSDAAYSNVTPLVFQLHLGTPTLQGSALLYYFATMVKV